MSNEIVLTKTEATTLLLLLSSITHAELTSEEGVELAATLDGIRKRIGDLMPDAKSEQFCMWERLGGPSWIYVPPKVSCYLCHDTTLITIKNYDGNGSDADDQPCPECSGGL